jgi:HSP20 family protein
MASRDFNPLDLIRQIELDFRRSAEGALRVVQFQPHMDMYETVDNLVIKMELSGVRPEKISITLSADNRTLTISGERYEPSQEHRDRLCCYHLEIFYGEFERDISLPGKVHFDRDNIKANYRDGFLLISLPKQHPTSTEKRSIEITNE